MFQAKNPASDISAASARSRVYCTGTHEAAQAGLEFKIPPPLCTHTFTLDDRSLRKAVIIQGPCHTADKSVITQALLAL